jgi:arylsulfatase A-like enzyme
MTKPFPALRYLLVGGIVLTAGLARAQGLAQGQPARSRPNIVVILADDLGYGDVRCMYPAGKIATPNLDKVATAGMKFTDAHTGSGVCSPTRYGLLTGRYCWRSTLQRGVLWGYSPRLIEPRRPTLAALLAKNGYRTACVGKWHLGVDWALKAGGIARAESDLTKIDYARPFANGPLTVGFDEFFGIAGSLDMPPFVFLEGDRVLSVPTTEKTWIRKGPAASDFEAIDVLPSLTDRAVAIIEREAPKAHAGRPFFLYLALASPHTPIVPTAAWQGRSGLNAYADFVMETDAAIGRVLKTLDDQGVAEQTLLFITSDNGFSPQGGLDELRARGHDPSAGFRGHKADIYEGGHRVPFLVRWPGKVQRGATCDQTIGLVDLMATCVEAVGASLPAGAGEDSVSFLPALLGRPDRLVRASLVYHSVDGAFGLRQANWKLALCPGSGGWSEPKPGSDAERGSPDVQLFDLAADPAERLNLAAAFPEHVNALTHVLERLVADGRTTPGPREKNAIDVDIRQGITDARRAEKPRTP